jgi:CheY-like chemotaxis protein
MNTSPIMKILIVEDSAEIVALLKAILKDPKLELVVCTNGREAYDVFLNDRFSLVLLDIQMPEWDGYKTVEAMRFWELQNSIERTPIIALTVSSDFQSSRRILNAGFDLHLTKPISRLVLMQTVAQYRPKTLDTIPHN